MKEKVKMPNGIELNKLEGIEKKFAFADPDNGTPGIADVSLELTMFSKVLHLIICFQYTVEWLLLTSIPAHHSDVIS